MARWFMSVKKIKNKKLIWGWLRKAEDDLSFAKMAFKETEFYDHVCFLSQQAVEKYLQTVIVASRGELQTKERTHNLIYLAGLCKKQGIDLSDFEEHLRKLTEAYIPARYPANGYTKFNKKDAKECLEIAQGVIQFIKDKIRL